VTTGKIDNTPVSAMKSIIDRHKRLLFEQVTRPIPGSSQPGIPAFGSANESAYPVDDLGGGRRARNLLHQRPPPSIGETAGSGANRFGRREMMLAESNHGARLFASGEAR
jgi:hypothetical protein